MNSSSESRSNRLLYLVSLNHLVNDSSIYLVSSLFPAIVLAFGFSELEIGTLVALGYLMNMIFQPMTGRLSEKYEERKLLALGISLMAVSMLLFTISSTFLTMLVSVLVLRVGSSFYHPVGVSVISRNYAGKRLDSSMGFQSSFGNLGVMLAFLLSAPLYLALSWKGPFLIYAGLESATVVVTLTLMRKARLQYSVKESTTVITQETNHHPVVDGAVYSKNSDPPFSNSTRTKFRLGLPLFFISASLVTGASFTIFSNFGNLLLVQNGFGFSLSDYLIALWVGVAFVGAMLSGWLTRRLTRTRLLFMTYFLAGVATLGFAFARHNVVLILPALAVSGFMDSITYPAIYSAAGAFIQDHPEVKRGPAYGVLFSGQIAGSSIFGFLSGYLADAYGLQLPFVIGALMLVCFSFVVYAWSKRITASSG